MPAPTRQQGNFIQADFFDNVGGLNITDSPFKVNYTQAVDGYNYEYTSTGGIRKRSSHTRLNTSLDTQTNALGMFLHNSTASAKILLRAAGVKLQSVNTTLGTSTTITDDTNTTASTAFSTTQPVVFTPFNTTSASLTWLAGGGQGSGILNGFNGTNYTKNGAAIPTGSPTSATTTGTQNLATGSYRYAFSLVKSATGAESNAALDTLVSVTAGADKTVKLTFALTTLDTTKYSYIKVYRSAVSGASGFTVGDLVATVASTALTVDDDGSVASSSAVLIPRAGNTLLDNSVLGSGTYNVVTTWKRRLVTAVNSTLYFSDVNKPESWPTGNTITVPSGGAITAVGVISYLSPWTGTTDELLAVFKERELWIVTGSNFVTLTNSASVVYQSSDIALKFVDAVGCVAQPLLVLANGFLFWIDYRGIYLWDGNNKPVYASRPIEYDFSPAGDIDRSLLTSGCGAFYRKQNEVIWFLSSVYYGAQKLALKLDLRLTLPGAGSAIAGRTLEGVFIKDRLTYNIYACTSALPTYDEVFYGGGNEGRTWKLYNNENTSVDDDTAIQYSYKTRPEDLGLISTTKRFHKIIVWCRDTTTGNLTLNYWVNYKPLSPYKAAQAAQITTQVTNGLWDQGTWDAAFWDTNAVTYTPVVFNLGNPTIGTEGEAITLEFSQTDSNVPLTIAGYSIIFSIAGLRN